MILGFHRLLRPAILVVSLLGPAAANAADAGVYVYLEPLPTEAARLAFAIGSVSALDIGGSEHPLTLKLAAVRPETAGRQRLLASGRLPVGTYTGFDVTLKAASLKREGGEAALSVPDTPVRIDVPFSVAAAQGTVLWLSLRYDGSIRGVEFDPLFVGAAPPRPIADHAGFVSNSGSNTVTVFDKSLAKAVGVIETCAGPTGMALEQRRRRLYVACSTDDEIQAIDVATLAVIERTRLAPGDRPRDLALTPDGLTLLAASTGSSTVSFFDAVSLARQDRVGVGNGPATIAIDPTGKQAFVFNTLSSSISVIDIPTRRVVATMSTEASPVRAAFSGRGDRIYVIHERSPYMTVLDARQLTIVTRARLRIGVGAVAVDTVRNLVCIGGETEPAIEFYDPNALMPLYAMKTPGGATYLTFDAEANSLYIVNTRERRIAIARLTDRRIAGQIDVGDSPYAVAVMGER